MTTATTNTITSAAPPSAVIWTEEKIQAAIIEFLFKQDSPQSYYQLREGTGVDSYVCNQLEPMSTALFPSLAKLRAKHKIWRQDTEDGGAVRYSLSLSTWLKMAERHQAAKRALKGR